MLVYEARIQVGYDTKLSCDCVRRSGIMSVIDDLATAVPNYATNDCNTTITGYSVTTGTSTGPTGTLNSGDEFQFEVMVFNDGEFDMKNVKIQVNGSNWADVALSGSTGVFGPTALLDPTPP